MGPNPPCPLYRGFLSSLSSGGRVALLSHCLLHCNHGTCQRYNLDTLWCDVQDHTQVSCGGGGEGGRRQ